MAWMYESGGSGDDSDDTDGGWIDEDADEEDASAHVVDRYNCGCGGHDDGNEDDVVAGDDDSEEDDEEDSENDDGGDDDGDEDDDDETTGNMTKTTINAMKIMKTMCPLAAHPNVKRNSHLSVGSS